MKKFGDKGFKGEIKKHDKQNNNGGAKRGAGRPPSPKDPTLIQFLYDQIDKRLRDGAFEYLDSIIKQAKSPKAPVELKKLAAHLIMEMIDKRLPKPTGDEDTKGVTIIIKNPIPGMKVNATD